MHWITFNMSFGFSDLWEQCNKSVLVHSEVNSWFDASSTILQAKAFVRSPCIYDCMTVCFMLRVHVRLDWDNLTRLLEQGVMQSCTAPQSILTCKHGHDHMCSGT